jgi:hypothetical protein
VNQISGTTPTDAPTQASAPQPAAQSQPAQAAASPAPNAPAGTDAPDSHATAVESPGFHTRGSARRRARFLRKARELAYRDLGGLVFNLHRFGQRSDALVLAKLTTLTHIDAELRTIETWLQERQPITVLREAGITACPRCAAIHSSEDSFCPNCGLPMNRHVDLPAGFQSTAAPAPAQPPAPLAATAPAPMATAQAPSAPAASAHTPAPETTVTPSPAAAVAPRSTTERAASGRSPSPPGSAGNDSSPSPADATTAPAEEDGPTEILRPPVPGA